MTEICCWADIVTRVLLLCVGDLDEHVFERGAAAGEFAQGPLAVHREAIQFGARVDPGLDAQVEGAESRPARPRPSVGLRVQRRLLDAG